MKLMLNLTIGLLIFFTILRIFDRQSTKQRSRFLFIFSLIGVVFYLINWAVFIVKPHLILELLPLQLCDLAVFLMPVGLWTKKQGLLDFLFYACGLGALSALILMGMADEEAFYTLDLNFFFSHFAILALPYLTIVWGMYDPKPSLRKGFTLTVVLLILSGLMHGLNLYLSAAYHVDAYYFFTIRKIGVEVSPLLKWFASILPYDYWYMTLTLPILYLYMTLVGHVRSVILKHYR